MTDLLWAIVAVEMLVIPAWAAAAAVGPPARLVGRLLKVPGPVVLVGGALVVLTAVGAPAGVVGVLWSQGVALAFALLVAGLAVLGQRLLGERAGQALAALAGWMLIGSAFLAGAAAGLLEGAALEQLVRWAVHANPLVVAEAELGLAWLQQGLTYRHSPLGETYGYLVGDLAAWKTCLGYAFVGSGALVFGIQRKALS